ncbi:hypothetical protein V8E54_015085 [Elaphomyces granulatus]
MPRPRGRSTVALTINPRRRKRRTAGRRPCGRPATLAPEPLGTGARFPDGPLVNEGKFCLFLERVIEPYRIAPAPAPASKKRKRAPNEAAVPTAEDADAEALARDMGISRVKQAWQQWKDGYGGNPPVEQLERDWGARWRPEARMRQWFSRRKVIWDRLREIVNAGQTPDARCCGRPAGANPKGQVVAPARQAAQAAEGQGIAIDRSMRFKASSPRQSTIDRSTA